MHLDLISEYLRKDDLVVSDGSVGDVLLLRSRVFFFVTPLDPLSLFPDSFPFDVLLLKDTSPVLLAILPLALVNPSISESKHPVSFFLVVLVVALIAPAV